MRSTPRIALALALLALAPAGCGREQPAAATEACWACQGSGRTPRGACLACAGRGVREVDARTADRRALAEENVRRADRGDAPLTDTEWWVARHWKPVAFFVLGGLAVASRTWGRRGPAPAPPTA